MSYISDVSFQSSQTDVFICCSLEDKTYLEDLRKYFKHDTRQNNLAIWDNITVAPGLSWQQETMHALQSAKVAILLISADFFASDFIDTHILPQLLNAASQKSIIIISVILRPCGFEDTELAQFQPINLSAYPLTKMERPKQEEIWVKVVKRVREITEQSNATFGQLYDLSEMLKTTAQYFFRCRYMKDKRLREQVLRQLPAGILQEIDAFPVMEQDNHNTNLEEVLNLVTICSSDNGLEKLAYALYRLEHASLSWQELDKYLRKTSGKLVTYTRLQELYAILKPVKWLDPLLSRVYKDSVPENWETLRDYDVHDKLYLILENLADIVHQDDAFPILEFTLRLAYQALERQERSLHDALIRWVKERSHDLSLTKIQENALQENARKQRRSAAFYLLLTLDIVSENTVCVQSWLFDDENNIIQNANVELPDELYLLEDIAGLLKDLLERCDNYLSDDMENLIIEFFLPLELLSYPVDQYSIDGFNKLQSISRYHQVVVRSLERMRNKRRPYIWKNKWKLFLDSIDEEPILGKHNNAVLVYDEEYHKRQEDLSLTLEGSSVVCFAMTFVPSATSSQIDTILSAVLDAKIPIILWARQQTNYPRTLQELFTELVSQHSLSQLPARIKQQRYEALMNSETMNHQGHHLILLWDDPNRLPPSTMTSKQLAMPSERRGA